ncbi:alpha-N-acetylglucosaminidase TIM-barrel domain-containing protein [Labrys portucalensis]|uniref:Alpha-N-acetylglucosaminidase TIM-barrel domain-containing protein n=1 Tax=Labrys neptuniae TaxID=376174 RepID=A0ABV6ZSL3_9HYPH
MPPLKILGLAAVLLNSTLLAGCSDNGSNGTRSQVPSTFASPDTSTQSNTATLPIVETLPQPAAIAALLKRLLPQQHQQFAIVIQPDANGAERYTISGKAGAIAIEATTTSAALYGVLAYLQQVAHVDVGWPGDSRSKLPATLPAPQSPITGNAKVKHRFALNDTDDGYSDAYLDWAGWERKIDLLGLHGFNQVFVPTGTEEVYRRTFQKFGYSDDDMRAWIPLPAHQPWWLLQNLYTVGPPLSSKNVNMFNARVAMGQRILARLRELDMTPVLPGYFGTVPTNFPGKNPGANVVSQGPWVGPLGRPDWLDPRQDIFAAVAAEFYRVQTGLFGDTTTYKMDLLHEGGKSGNVPVTAAGAAVATALKKAHPGSSWVMLGWQSNPPSDVIAGAKAANVPMFIVDGLSDRYDNLNRENAWTGTPYAFGSIPNFGGHTTIGANTGVWAQVFPAWRTKLGSALQGTAWLPEGSGRDPGAFARFSALAWEDAASTPDVWFKQYANFRYGGADAQAELAWNILATTAYSMPSNTWSEAPDSLYNARPSFAAATAASWSPKSNRYDTARFAQALVALLKVDPALRQSDAYKYDLVDVARQVLSNKARDLLPKINAAFNAKDKAQFALLTKEWLDNMALLDRLLRTDSRFLLGTWEANARAAGQSDAERAQLVYDQRSIISTWWNSMGAATQLHDYANRELSGLVSDLYLPRWQAFFDAAKVALEKNTSIATIDWFAMENSWANKWQTQYPTTPSGDSYALAGEIAKALGLISD